MSRVANILLTPIAWLGRPVVNFFAGAKGGVEAFARVFQLLWQTLYWTFIGPFTGKTRYRQLVFPLMQQIGVRSLFIVCLVGFLVGFILILNTADQLKQYGALSKAPTMICIAVVRELGPLMTAIVLSGRVGAAFTAGLGSMVINEEVLALETMGINPVGYLVAPRFIAICVMLPCLTMFSYLVGNLGGLAAGNLMYNISLDVYWKTAMDAFAPVDMLAGLIKALVFAATICMVACYNAFSVRGGPEGVGRNTMISVVNCLVAIIISDALVTAITAKYFWV
ncbi:MAG: phospholipid/cholesterol/gamma-HCH transport system permease protein [Planctomycetota bacterium]|jgi:phospholipid/cholesterol/gamma-HCH transport system permease protein